MRILCDSLQSDGPKMIVISVVFCSLVAFPELVRTLNDHAKTIRKFLCFVGTHQLGLQLPGMCADICLGGPAVRHVCCHLFFGRPSSSPGDPAVGDVCCHLHLGRPSNSSGGPAVGDMGCHLHLERPSSNPRGPTVGLGIFAIMCIWGGLLAALGVQLLGICAGVEIWGGTLAALRVQASGIRAVTRLWKSRRGSRRSRRRRKILQEYNISDVLWLPCRKWAAELIRYLRRFNVRAKRHGCFECRSSRSSQVSDSLQMGDQQISKIYDLGLYARRRQLQARRERTNVWLL